MRGIPMPRTRWGGGILVVALLASAAGVLAPVSDAKTDSRVYSLHQRKKKVLGLTPSDWAIQWNQWSASIPTSVHPLIDETGAFVEVGQRGSVWFLGGVYNVSGSVTRTATIPAGKALFFPLVDVEMDNVGRPAPVTFEQMKAEAAEAVALVDPASLILTIDGTPVLDLEKGRIASDEFSYATPDGNLGQYFGQVSPRGIYAPAVTDGYWAMLKPLSLGVHTLHFGGTFGGSVNFTVDATYNLTVVESNQP